jgi:pyrimidine deaminase RibD-like protein
MHESDLDFMRTAIAEAKRSRHEDDRIHPCVGAVLAKDGVLLASAYRGESGKGDHAEYVTLETKLRTTSIAGSTLYTTLEPCTTRNHPKVPCAQRIVERKIARVYIGQLDPNPSICGRGIWHLRRAGIEVQLFPGMLQDAVDEFNRDFQRAHMSTGSKPAVDQEPAVPQAPSPVVAAWQRKLIALQTELARTVDPEQKHRLRELVREAQLEIADALQARS